MAKNPSNNIQLVEAIIHGMLEKKASNIVHIDLTKLKVSVADDFVICHADNDKQVEALADSVVDQVRKILNEKPNGVEGKRESEWVLLDYVNVVVHIFKTEKRELYGIEDLWGDGEVRKIQDSYKPQIG